MNMKVTFAVMKLIWSIYTYIFYMWLTKNGNFNLKMNKILQRKWNIRKIQIEKHQQHDLLTT